MKKYLKLILLILLVVLTTFFLYCISPLVLDGIWNYGFGHNINQGLIPYRDFNMIIPPIFPYLIALFLHLMGDNLIVYYLLISTMIVLTTVISYKKIGYNSILIYLIILIYPHNGYNTFALFLLFILLYILDKDNNDITIAIIISLMFLTKQTLGVLIVPSIIYSKKKKKTISIYLLSILLLILYLLINNNLFEFIDYCFLGMLDFTSKNISKFSVVTIIEIISCLYLLIELVKTKFKEKQLFYILLFQIIAFPITDSSHFILTFSTIIYYLFSKYYNKKYLIFLLTIILIFYILGNLSDLVKEENYKYDSIYQSDKSPFNYKRFPNFMENYFDTIKSYKESYPNYRIYILDSRAYLAKLELNIPINKYDLINNGNMGYKGSHKFINEIDNYCENNKCLFIVNREEIEEGINQTNQDIISYVAKKYQQISSSNIVYIYIN